jgi:hypothetical protein
MSANLTATIKGPIFPTADFGLELLALITGFLPESLAAAAIDGEHVKHPEGADNDGDKDEIAREVHTKL